MVLYRFLFAPVLLAVAVLTTSPRPVAPPAGREAAARVAPVPAHEAPAGEPRALASHPATDR